MASTSVAGDSLGANFNVLHQIKQFAAIFGILHPQGFRMFDIQVRQCCGAINAALRNEGSA